MRSSTRLAAAGPAATARRLPPHPAMRVLEARFYPRPAADGEFVVVAYVVWKRDGGADLPTVQPSAELIDSAALATMLLKLEFLVTHAAPDAFTRLKTLKSQFWSFVDVTPRA
jgi:hypothetical protein